jgi:hypothetical protein
LCFVFCFLLLIVQFICRLLLLWHNWTCAAFTIAIVISWLSIASKIELECTIANCMDRQYCIWVIYTYIAEWLIAAIISCWIWVQAYIKLPVIS